MSNGDKAFERARAAIREAADSCAPVLYLSWRQGFRALDRLPDEIATLTTLESLNLTSTNVTDLAPLAGLQALQSLNLSGTNVTDLAALAVFPALRSLNLQGTKVTDLRPLGDLICFIEAAAEQDGSRGLDFAPP